MSAPHTHPRATQSSHYVTTQYDPEPRRDVVRAILALALVAFILGLAGYAAYCTHGDFGKILILLDKLLPAVVGLVGTAIGFYFGSKNKER